MMEHIETIIVGGGQAGLATSYHLTQYGREHVILEQAAQAANVWRDQRWDSFTLVTPNWSLKMPGAEYNGAAPNGFMPRAEVVTYFDKYVERFRLPVECNTQVLSIEPLDGKGYRIQTSRKTLTAKNVVIATGFFQKPKIPPFAAGLSPDITQLHSSAYRNPESLPDGPVLIVGSAQSGCQIAEELYQHGRKVFLCTGSAGRAPRRYRGKDVIEWMHLAGAFDLTPEQLPPGMGKFKGIPHFSGTKGGHTLNLHQFARDGVTLVGHLLDASDDQIFLASDLRENLESADRFEEEVLQMIDDFIESNGLDAPPEELPRLRDGYEQAVIAELDLKAYGIKTVIWAMGYTFDYSLVKLPVRDGDGFPIQTNGVADYPGLYFSGMPWMPSEKSGFLLGVGERAGTIASQIAQPGTPERRA
ncbi:MAG: FAD-dependent oxidoreductase [Chloroflexi bacterium]|nr:MAG: FAD-dependent oxidoreductase [Chloroflexota bacterium]